MFVEHAFLDRFDAAADAGFAAVEFLFPYDHGPEAIAARLERNHLTQALFNLPPGRWEDGERGLAALPGRFEEFKSGLAHALDYVAATQVKRLHMMAGNVSRSDAEAEASYRRAISYAAPASTCFWSRSTREACLPIFSTISDTHAISSVILVCPTSSCNSTSTIGRSCTAT